MSDTRLWEGGVRALDVQVWAISSSKFMLGRHRTPDQNNEPRSMGVESHLLIEDILIRCNISLDSDTFVWMNQCYCEIDVAPLVR